MMSSRKLKAHTEINSKIRTENNEFKGHDTLVRMCGNLISHPTEKFSKLLFVSKLLLHRPCEACENSNTDIEELF